MSKSEDDRWQCLVEAQCYRLPYPLLETLGFQSGRWLKDSEILTDYKQMHDLDMSACIKAFASLGRCSVGVGLYMAGAINQLRHGEDVTKIEHEGSTVRVVGRPEAGYFYLLNETYVVPHEFHCWWRLARTSASPLELHPISAVQNLDVDGTSLFQVQIPTSRRPWLPHQRRSLCWMAHREAVRDLFVCESSISKPSGLLSVDLEWKMDKAFDLRGGVLCDPVGSGKTATALGLLLLDASAMGSDWYYEGSDAVKDIFAGSWLTLNATLVLCPDHVHEQWLQESQRTLPADVASVLAIRTVSELRSAAPFLRQLAEREKGTQQQLVVAALSILHDPEYQELISPANSEIRGWLEGQGQWTQGLALDCFLWRRLIIDEVHEAVHCCDRGKCSMPCPRAALTKHLRALKSERRWGLTGTAQEVLREAASVQSLAQIFRTDFNSEVSSCRFVEHYCRTNQVDLDLRVCEQTELIDSTGFEAIVYKQHERDLLSDGLDGTGSEPLSEKELSATIPLLKLCSHFQLGKKWKEEDKATAGLRPDDVAKQIYEEKELALQSAKVHVDKQFDAENTILSQEDTKPLACEAMIPLEVLDGLWVASAVVDGDPVVVLTRIEATACKSCPKLQVGDRVTAMQGKPIFSFAKELKQLQQDLEETNIAKPPSDFLTAELQQLELRRQVSESFRKELRARAAGHEASLAWRKTGEASAYVVELGPAEMQRRVLASAHGHWKHAAASFRFLQKLWEGLMSEGDTILRKPQECPICQDSFDAALTGVVLRCGHMYCEDCHQELVKRRATACPLCRSPIHSERDAVHMGEFAKARALTQNLENKELQHGSKIAHIAEVLRGILAHPGKERAVVFCQFADLEWLISSALHDHGIDHACLSAAKDIFEQTAILDGFQQRTGKQRVLLLSLEMSASGTNLTTANHVLLVHPMAAATPERAVVFEQQAIGRCVRLGQQRQVTVWRFVTKGTVEEALAARLAEWRHSLQMAETRKTAAGSGKAAVKAVRGLAGAAVEAKVKGRGRGPRAQQRRATAG